MGPPQIAGSEWPRNVGHAVSGPRQTASGQVGRPSGHVGRCRTFRRQGSRPPDAKGELQLIGTRGEPEPSGLFRLSYGTEPNDPVPFILTLTPQYVARAIGKTAPTDIRNYAEQNADKLKAIATFEKARGAL